MPEVDSAPEHVSPDATVVLRLEHAVLAAYINRLRWRGVIRPKQRVGSDDVIFMITYDFFCVLYLRFTRKVRCLLQ